MSRATSGSGPSAAADPLWLRLGRVRTGSYGNPSMFHPDGPTFWELARQALSSTQRGYDLLAPKFDVTPFRTPDALLEAVAPVIGPPGSIDAALDVCCGTGAAMRMLRPLCRHRVCGIDFSHNMLRVAEQRLADAKGTAQLEFVFADALDMPFESEFDVAVSFGAVGHILPRDQPRWVELIARALKPGGRFIVATAYMPPVWSPRYLLSRGFNAAMHARNLLMQPPFHMYYLTFLVPEATRMLESAGFRVDVLTGVFPRPFRDVCLVVGVKLSE